MTRSKIVGVISFVRGRKCHAAHGEDWRLFDS